MFLHQYIKGKEGLYERTFYPKKSRDYSLWNFCFCSMLILRTRIFCNGKVTEYSWQLG